MLKIDLEAEINKGHHKMKKKCQRLGIKTKKQEQNKANKTMVASDYRGGSRICIHPCKQNHVENFTI